MVVVCDCFYVQFNFYVNFGDGVINMFQVGFQEVSGIGMEVIVIEYCFGNYVFNNVIKMVGLNKVIDVMMKCGVIGLLDFYKWLDDVCNGVSNGLCIVIVEFKSEDCLQMVQIWCFINVWIMKYIFGFFNVKGIDVVMEELMLFYECLEME